MKKSIISCIVALSLMLLLSLSAFTANNSPVSLNAQFMNWQEKTNILHIFVLDDIGRSHVGPAYVDVGQPLLFGFETGDTEGDVEWLQAHIDNPTLDVTLAVSGDTNIPEFSIKNSYQEAFFTETQLGPAWKWDHDGDGPGDGDDDGFEDWDGAIAFFRYPHPGLQSGIYYFTFTYYREDFFEPYIDIITVIVP